MVEPGDIALLMWGAMGGSWITSVWIMRKKPNIAETSMRRFAAEIAEQATRLRRIGKITPGASITSEWKFGETGRFKVTLVPIDQEREDA